MSFIPPIFCKFGKDARDLFKKNYEFKHQATLNSKPWAGMTLDTIFTENEKALEGKIKTKYEHSNFGTIDFNYNTLDGAFDSELRTTRLHKNAVGTLKVESSNVKGGVEFRAQNFAVTGHANYGLENQGVKVETSLVGDFNGLSFGGQVSYNVKDAAVDDFNVGVEYNRNKSTFSAITSNKLDDLSLGVYSEVENRTTGLKNTQVGIKLETQTTTFDNAVLSVGAIHQCSVKHLCRGKIDTKGALALVLEHRLEGGVTLSLASQWNVLKRSSAPEKLGLGIKIET